VLAWAGGAIFTAQLVMNPYFTKGFPYRNLDHGALRALPVELTMVNDLPVMLDVTRAPLEFKGAAGSDDPTLWLYLLDENAYSPEPAGIWVMAERRTDVVVRTTQPLASLRVTLSAPISNHVWVALDGRHVEADLKPGTAVDVMIPAGAGVYSIGGYDYLLSMKAANGMVPFITVPGSKDRRYLGVLFQLRGVVRR
jgi:hypothetical protein